MTVVDAAPARFGTFTGVFTPTLLTILGVILYVRTGWVVGNAGLLGAFAILGLAILITTCTGLSLSSIATNTRIGAGGPYAIMTRSLGLEVGGSIGIPLYLTRPLGVAMYIFGFREGLLWIIPDLPTLPPIGSWRSSAISRACRARFAGTWRSAPSTRPCSAPPPRT